MTVSINYKGRFGNCLFQYVSARIFAEKNNLNLVSTIGQDVAQTKPHKHNEEDIGQIIKKIDHKSFIDDEIPFSGNQYNYMFDDFFQNGNYINNNAKLVDSFFSLPKVDRNYKDIVMHVRLDDYVHTNVNNPQDWSKSEIVSPAYYLSILDKEEYSKLYIVVDKLKTEWEKKYIDYFKRYSPVIINNTPAEDFNFIRRFDKMIISNSTFAYWAAFLSHAKKIYTFKNTGYFGRPLHHHGGHVKNINNIKNVSISIDEEFYFGKYILI